jgi:hypothetical protein
MAGIISQPKSNKGAVVGAPNMFGAPPNNSNRQALNHNNWIQTNDATAVNNLLSPLALTTTIVTLVVPTNAVTVTFIADAATKISEVADLSQYITLPANVPITFDCARQANFYANTATTGNLSFVFATL